MLRRVRVVRALKQSHRERVVFRLQRRPPVLFGQAVGEGELDLSADAVQSGALVGACAVFAVADRVEE